MTSLSSSVPHLLISVADDVSELSIDIKSVFVQTIPDCCGGPESPDLGGTGGGVPLMRGGRGGISEARRRVEAVPPGVGSEGIVVSAKSE